MSSRHRLINNLKEASVSSLKSKFGANRPKDKRIRNFLDWKLTAKRTDIDLDKNWAIFEVEEKASKPEIKQYIEKVYGMKVLKVNTVRTMGKIQSDMMGKRYRNEDIKKAYVWFDEEVPEEVAKLPTF